MYIIYKIFSIICLIVYMKELTNRHIIRERDDEKKSGEKI